MSMVGGESSLMGLTGSGLKRRILRGGESPFSLGVGGGGDLVGDGEGVLTGEFEKGFLMNEVLGEGDGEGFGELGDGGEELSLDFSGDSL